MIVINHANTPHHTQAGGALIIMAFILALASTTALLAIFDTSSVKIQRNKETAMILTEAKAALIGFSTQATSGGTRPGDLIRPDTASEGTPDYNGTADASCLDSTKTDGLPMVTGGSGVDMRCLGRLPWKDIGMSIHDPSESDPSGIMPWYAVSANLVDPTCLEVLNSNTLSLPPAAFNCPSATLPYPWLTVRDGKGNILSNRVAAVILIPGAARGTQARSSTGLSSAAQYLDTLIVPTDCATPCISGTYSNADMDNDFIMASENTAYAFVNNFNDQLVYITIEELMSSIEKRAAGEMRALLNSYKNKNSFFPYAATLGSNSYSSTTNTYEGMLPINITDTCSCTSNTNCTCSFGLVSSVAFTKSGTSSFISRSNNCSITSSKKCTCTGQGSCSTSTRNFSCSALGSCTYSGSTTGTYKFTPHSYGDMVSSTNSCTINSTADCTGAGSFNIGLKEPTWFKDNLWQEVFYYRRSISTPDLQVGEHTGIEAVVISAGSSLSAQIRPSSNLSDYLDSTENTNGDRTFDTIGTSRSASYNDQMFIVAP